MDIYIYAKSQYVVTQNNCIKNDINFMAASYFIIMINMVYRDMMSQLKSASVHYGFRI